MSQKQAIVLTIHFQIQISFICISFHLTSSPNSKVVTYVTISESAILRMKTSSVVPDALTQSSYFWNLFSGRTPQKSLKHLNRGHRFLSAEFFARLLSIPWSRTCHHPWVTTRQSVHPPSISSWWASTPPWRFSQSVGRPAIRPVPFVEG